MRALPALLLVLALGMNAPATGFPPPAPAAEEWEKPSLHVGDPAPALAVGTWCKGEPVERFERGHIYVVEFFATYDPACRDDWKHLAALQEQWGKRVLTVVGVATRTARESEPVSAFVERMGDRMGFRVGVDEGGKCEQAWMRSAQRYSLPCAVVVDRDGKVAWIGSVRCGLAGVVESIMNNTFSYEQQARSDARFADLERQFTDARREGEWDKAFAVLDEAKRFRPETAAMVEATRFEVMLTEKQDAGAAYTLAQKIITNELKDEERLLRRVAGVIAENPAVKNRNWDVALAAVQQAVKATGGRDGWALGALAEIQFRRGEVEQAVQTQIKAMIVAEGDPHLSPRAGEAMDRYRIAQSKGTGDKVITTVPGTD
ncbi:MAG: redoxin domain-containing protein [Phycisphaerales bacterium]